MQLDENFKKLIGRLGNAINDSLAESKSIAEILDEIRSSGYDLFLVLEVTIGFNKREEDADPGRRFLDQPGQATEFRLTNQDNQFLRDLKIRVEDNRK